MTKEEYKMNLFEKYDLKLNDDFTQYVLEQTK